VTSNFLITVRE